jgi:SanA protein
MWKALRFYLISIPLIIIVSGILILACSLIVTISTQPYIYEKVEDVPANKVGLLLGTSKYTLKGQINPFYQNRIDAAVALFESGKVEYILVSGDNRHRTYNEPREMRRDLLEANIPADRIVADTAGIRTLDSVIRSRLVFGQDSVTIISQAFHVERAIYIAHHAGYAAVGFAAKDVEVSFGLKTYIREYLARVKLMLDLYVSKTQPAFIGDEIPVGK